MTELLERLIISFLDGSVPSDQVIHFLTPPLKRLISVTANYRYFIRFDTLDSYSPAISSTAANVAFEVIRAFARWVSTGTLPPPLHQFLTTAALELKSAYNLQPARRQESHRRDEPTTLELTAEHLSQIQAAAASQSGSPADSPAPHTPSRPISLQLTIPRKPPPRRGGKRK